jgi:hypothetical protein
LLEDIEQGVSVVSRQVCSRRGIIAFPPRNPFWRRKATMRKESREERIKAFLEELKGMMRCR